MSAYYNEIDPQCAEWLRNLIKAGHIADGEVDNRSILDVSPKDLKGFSQCHFFAGIGVWSRALRLAGWRDDQRVWTGSCPCQPFSAAGVRGGFADERHLWPAFFHLIEQCAPPTVFGEQVASKDGLEWIDLVQADMEGAGYTFGATDLCAAGVGAPHIRQRLWFVGSRLADAELHGYPTGTLARSVSASESEGRLLQLEGCSAPERMADTSDTGSQGRVSGRQDARREGIDGYAGRGGAIERLGNTDGGRRLERAHGTGSDGAGVEQGGREQIKSSETSGNVSGLGNTNNNRRGALTVGELHNPELDAESFRDLIGLADATDEQRYGCGESGSSRRGELTDYSDLIGLANPHDDQHEPQQRSDGFENGEAPSDGQNVAVTWQLGGTSDALCGVADTASDGYANAPRSSHVRRVEQFERRANEPAKCVEPSTTCSTEFRRLERPPTGPTNGFWRDADWLFCRDGKWRPVEPQSFPLVNGATSRVVRLRAYGNAINAEVAATFIEAATDGLLGLDLI